MRRSATVAGSSFKGGVQFKSPRRVIVRFLLRSRERATGKLRKLREGYETARRESQRLIRQRAAVEAGAGDGAAPMRRLECEQGARLQEARWSLTSDAPVW